MRLVLLLPEFHSAGATNEGEGILEIVELASPFLSDSFLQRRSYWRFHHGAHSSIEPGVANIKLVADIINCRVGILASLVRNLL